MKRTRRLRRWACSGNWTLHVLFSVAIPQAAPMPDMDMPDMGFMFMFMFMFMPAMFMLTDGALEPISRLTASQREKKKFASTDAIPGGGQSIRVQVNYQTNQSRTRAEWATRSD